MTVFSFSCRNRPSIASLGIIVREEGLLSVANNHGPPAANIVDAVFQETITIPRRPASRKLPVLPVPLRSIVSVTTRPCSTVFTRGRVGRGRSERTYLVAHPQAPDSAISRICKNTRRARVYVCSSFQNFYRPFRLNNTIIRQRCTTEFQRDVKYHLPYGLSLPFPIFLYPFHNMWTVVLSWKRILFLLSLTRKYSKNCEYSTTSWKYVWPRIKNLRFSKYYPWNTRR